MFFLILFNEIFLSEIEFDIFTVSNSENYGVPFYYLYPICRYP